jgi:hypothetical protein
MPVFGRPACSRNTKRHLRYGRTLSQVTLSGSNRNRSAGHIIDARHALLLGHGDHVEERVPAAREADGDRLAIR